MIVCKKILQWYIEWKRVTKRVITSGTSNDNKWQRVVQWATKSSTTSDIKWWDTKNDNEWHWMTTSNTTNENNWEQVK